MRRQSRVLLGFPGPILGWARPEAEGAMTGFHFCLETDAFDAAVSELQAAGVPMVRPPHPTVPREPREENWRRVVFRGPDGEQIELRG